MGGGGKRRGERKGTKERLRNVLCENKEIGGRTVRRRRVRENIEREYEEGMRVQTINGFARFALVVI